MSLSEAIARYDPRSCLIVRHGRLEFEHYREPNMADEPARINSCTKSVLSALICAAVDRGLLPDPEHVPVSRFFPRLAADPDTRKRDMTLRHLLTMTAGFRWQEFGGMNSFPRMTRTADWIAHVLEQPLSEAPGTKMTYNSGVSQLLSAILSRESGMPTAQFAEQALFGPLGIEAYEWETDPQGIHTGGFGLRLRPADLLKLGQLMLQRGRWEDKRLFSPQLADLAVRPVVRASPPYDGLYAWHWWCGSYPTEGMDYYYAQGFGGQFVFVVPGAEAVAVVTQDSRKRKQPDLFAELIAPAVFAR